MVEPKNINKDTQEIAEKIVQLGTKSFEYTLKGFEEKPIVFENLTEEQIQIFNELNVRHFDTAIGRLKS